MMNWIFTLIKSSRFIPTESLVVLLILDIKVVVEVQQGPSRGLSFGSDEEFGPYSDLDEDFESMQTKKPVSGRNKTESGRIEEEKISKVLTITTLMMHGLDQMRMNNRGDDARFRSNGKMDNRRDYMMDDRRSSRRSRGDNRGSKWDDYGGQRMNKGDGAYFRSNGKMDNRRDSMMDGIRTSQGPCGDNRGSNGGDYDGRRMNNQKG
ncbi:hypothetical protein Dsin_023653 [Dipteronia sinensis]|uniref:Glycine-rich protein n=1 Tax=Dipteronia sinensis TaxID=43782 RepID=A0AAE0A408_9ROSI|nr:hypothetical protein Dsin_023653 [Dipteronia sinensis]